MSVLYAAWREQAAFGERSHHGLLWGRLKGYTLGVEVFDRGADFDPNIDPIVRVEVGRLRSKLIEHYASAGATDPVVIEIPKGGNAARIGFRANDAVSSTERHRRKEDQDVAERPSLAVIPFANLSADPDQEYFAPMLERVVDNCDAVPERTTADTGYFSAANVRFAVKAFSDFAF